MKAIEENALIFFGDESGYAMNITNGKTWGLKGKTPVVYANDQKKKVSVSGVISTEGDFFYEIYEGAMTAERYELFLSHLLETTHRTIYVIHDGLPSHRAQKIKDIQKRQNGRLRLFQIPGYSPELNPIEMIWAISKKEVKKFYYNSQEELRTEIINSMKETKLNADMIKSIIRHVYPQLC